MVLAKSWREPKMELPDGLADPLRFENQRERLRMLRIRAACFFGVAGGGRGLFIVSFLLQDEVGLLAELHAGVEVFPFFDCPAEARSQSRLAIAQVNAGFCVQGGLRAE